ncbi:hypothetical protein FRB90_002238 [Tulasnella sp. 427]|nr:hypothetical protein FRB90_002238 [Tulasnella sp. 427]
MYKLALFAILASSVFSLVSATVAVYGQCGGSGYTGETVCADPGVCTYLNYWYSQCLPPSTSALSSSTSKPVNTTTIRTTTTTITKIIITTTPTKTTTTTVGSTTCYTDLPMFSAPAVKAITPNTAVTGFYFHRRSDGKAVLNKVAAGIALWWTSPGTIALLEPSTTSDGKACQLKDYLNVLSDTTNLAASYKPLEFDLNTPISNYWSSTKLSVTAASPWGAQSWFLACPTSVANEYLVYLQTGTDVPAGQSCALTQLA